MPTELDLDFLKTPPIKKPTACKVGIWLAGLSKENRDAMLQALSNYQWTSEELVRRLHPIGVNIGVTTLRKHRRGDCSCVQK